MLPDDPYVRADDFDNMSNAMAWVMLADLDKSMDFIYSNSRIVGIWLLNFPTNACKRTVLHTFCTAHKSYPIKKVEIEAVIDKIYDDQYDIFRNLTKGGYDVILW